MVIRISKINILLLNHLENYLEICKKKKKKNFKRLLKTKTNILKITSSNILILDMNKKKYIYITNVVRKGSFKDIGQRVGNDAQFEFCDFIRYWSTCNSSNWCVVVVGVMRAGRLSFTSTH